MKIWLNVGSSDVARGETSADYVEMDLTNDKIIFTNGSAAVADGEALPTETQLNRAATILESTQKTVAKYFLYDYSAGTLKEIYGMGNNNARYVVCFQTEDATNSEPVLEAWDDSELDSVLLEMLGAGTPANSWLKGVVTTDGLPGADWSGTPLAGDTEGYYLNLNNGGGALETDTDLYANFKVVIPATAVTAMAVLPVMAVKVL